MIFLKLSPCQSLCMNLSPVLMSLKVLMPLTLPSSFKKNNVAFSDDIPKQFQNSGIKDFVNYVKSYPLRYVLYNLQDPFYPKQVCEFDYSCSVDSDAQTITGTIRDGQYRITIDVESF
ncbi:unnamed protein product [Lactuca saligna]|uniref:Uncharacterized protein n=1 Tax=Lactuca saligna TaxID=75948 RepID=A0AA35ZGS7_LACSI|nr:unnamed protein product [Lactuca saligna]